MDYNCKIMEHISTMWLFTFGFLGIFTSLDCQELLIYPPGTQTKQIKTGTILTCKVDKYSSDGANPIMFWRAPDGGTITSHSGRVHVERSDPMSYRLYISEVEAGDAGLYTCESLVEGETLTADVRLEIFEDITFRPSPDYIQTRIGESPLLECSATGRPQPTISWRFNRKAIHSDQVKYQSEARGLRIYNVNGEDGGFYECRAEVTSQGGLKVKQITLEVEYPPKFTHNPPATIQLVKGERAEIKCMGMGNPNISYQWSKEHKASQFAMVKVTLRQTTDTYVFEEVRKEDAGRYFCQIQNSLGKEEVHTDVTVVAASKVEEIEDETLLENSVLILTCKVDGDPEPTVQWQRVGSMHPYVDGVQASDPRVKVDNTRPGVSKLVIHDIQRSYSGQYRCSAYNKAGNDSKISTVSVEFGPTINSIDESKYGWPGQVRNFTCSGFGKPLPTLNWLRDGDYISDSETYTVYTETGDVITSTLQITVSEGESWVYGKYSCYAKNIYNYVPAHVELKEAVVPAMVSNATIAELTSTSVQLKASLGETDGNLPVKQWKIQYQAAKGENGETEEQTALFDLDEDLLVLGLDPGMLYTLYLSASNIVGFSEPIKFQIRTHEQKEQADLPIFDLPDDTNLHRTGSTAKESQKFSGGKTKDITSASSQSEAVVTKAVAVGVGVTVSLAVIVLIIVSVAIHMRRKARKEDDYTRTWKGMFGNGQRKVPLSDNDGMMVKISESKDIDQVQLEIRRVDGSQPDLIAHASPKPNHVDKCRSPFEIRKKGAAKNGNAPRLNSPGSVDTLQQRAWDQMIIKQAMQEEEEAAQAEQEQQKADELTPMVDLPPPPAFLLDNNEINALPQPDNVSYHDILDGYHSEENIDDRDSYQIRLPNADVPPTIPQHRYC